MSWLINSLVGGPRSEHDSSDDDDDESERGKNVGVSSDVAELGLSFRSRLKGISSYITGEDDASLANLRKAEKDSIVATDLPLGHDSVQNLTKVSDETERGRSEPETGQRISIDSESAESSAAELVQPKLSVMGMQNDLAELSGTFRSHLSKISSVVRVVRGDDLLPDASKSQRGEEGTDTAEEAMDYSAGVGDWIGNELHGNRMLSFLGIGPKTEEAQHGQNQSRDSSSHESDEADDKDSDDEEDGLLQAAKEDIGALTDSLASGISGISRFASSFLPFKPTELFGGHGIEWEGDEDEQEEEDGAMVGVNDVTVAFVRSIALRSETWIEFPLPSEDEDEDDDFELSDAQVSHIEGMQFAVPRLAALRLELTPEHMSDGRFWKIYFVLLQSKLDAGDAQILITPQVVDARTAVIQVLQERSQVGDAKNSPEKVENESHPIEEATPLPEEVVEDHVDPLPVSEKLPAVSVVSQSAADRSAEEVPNSPSEKEVDDWLDNDAPGEAVDVEDDISFSDLEEGGSRDGSHGSDKSNATGGESDWQKIEVEEVHSTK